MKPIGLLLLTYNRREYAIETLRSALDNLKCSQPFMVHIADDGSGEPYREELRQIAGGYSNVVATGSTDSMRGGYGKNYNLATQVLHYHCDYVLPLEDDWRLQRELDLDAILSAFQDERVGCVRMGYIGWTQSLMGHFVGIAGLTWLYFLPESPEPHVFAGHPRLESVAFQRNVGPWPEGLEPGLTEFVVAQRAEARSGVVWPLDLIPPRGDAFVHIGAVRSTDGLVPCLA